MGWLSAVCGGGNDLFDRWADLSLEWIREERRSVGWLSGENENDELSWVWNETNMKKTDYDVADKMNRKFSSKNDASKLNKLYE